MSTLELLEQLGMKKAADKTRERIEKNRKLHLAYQNFSFVPESAVDSFNQKLKEKTEVIYDSQTKEIRNKVDPKKFNYVVYDKLVFCQLSEYGEVPPVEVLEKIKSAMDLGCFDSFQVAKIESVKEVIDPIVFGSIEGCTDLFLIAQWDEDVKFEDIQKEVRDGYF